MNNFSTNRYIYVLVMGLTEIPAYLIPTPILMMIGRRLGSEILYIVAALCLLCILVIPTSETDVIILISLIGRFSASAAYGIVILYSSELFPTVNAPPFSPYYRIFIHFIFPISFNFLPCIFFRQYLNSSFHIIYLFIFIQSVMV